MRHQVAGRKLGKKTAHRLAMFSNMVTSLIEHGRIRTTLPKAKELRCIADQMVTLGKKDTLHARRQAFSFIRNEDAVKKLFTQIAPAFKARSGGYTRIYHIDNRPGDNSEMAIIEYLNEEFPKSAVKAAGEKGEKKAPKKKEAKKPAVKKEKVKKVAKAEVAEKPAKKPAAKKAKKETKE